MTNPLKDFADLNAARRALLEESQLLQFSDDAIDALESGGKERLARVEDEIRELLDTEDPKKIVEGMERLRSVRELIALLGETTQILKGLESVVDPKSTFFKDALLTQLYFEYLRRTENMLTPAAWASVTESTRAIERLEVVLGKDFRGVLRRIAEGRVLSVGDIPDIITQKAWDEYARVFALRKDLLFWKMDRLAASNAPEVAEALAKKPTSTSGKKLISSGHWNILKGNVGEILTHEKQMDVLTACEKRRAAGEFPGIQEVFLVTDVRYTSLDAQGIRRVNQEFSDNMVVGITKNGDYRILHVFEVKAGRDGAFEARRQFFRNLESKESIGIKFSGEAPRYRPDGTTLPTTPAIELSSRGYDPVSKQFVKGDPSREKIFVGLFSSEKTTFAPSDQLKLDIGDGLTTTGKTTSDSIGLTWDELESLTARLFLTPLFHTAL